MNYSEFSMRVAHNTAVLKHALENRINLVTISDKLYTWDTEPCELSFSVLMRNLHDIIPSLFLGSLASVNSNGVDAYEVDEENNIICIELKTSEIRSNKVWKLAGRYGLYTGIGTSRTQRLALSSTMSARYSFRTFDNLLAKNMKTVLFINDSDNIVSQNSYIDAWELSGDVVVEYLTRSGCKERDIKFASFMKNGKRANTVVPLIGFEKFKEHLQNVVLERDMWLKKNGYL